MQDLDSLISPIPGFEGAIPISACDPGVESSEDPSTGSSASASRTRACKRKAPINPSPPPQKDKKAVGKPLGRIKISSPKQKAHASTPPSGFRKGSRSSDQKGILILNTFFSVCLLIYKLSRRVPQDIPLASPAKNLPPETESPKVDKPPSTSAGKTFLEMLNPLGPEGINVWTGAASNPTSPSAADSRRDATHQSPRPDPTECQEASPLSGKSFGLGAHGGPQPGEGSSVPRLDK
jgi:hypothetical protein